MALFYDNTTGSVNQGYPFATGNGLFVKHTGKNRQDGTFRHDACYSKDNRDFGENKPLFMPPGKIFV
jgi:hypothetical protein